MAAPTEKLCENGGFLLTPLHKAAIHNDVRMVVSALECTALNIDAVTHEGKTALHIAAEKGHLPVAKALCEAGCDIEAIDGDGKTAVRISRDAGHTEVIQLLMTHSTRRNALIAAISGTSATAELDPDAEMKAMLALAAVGGGGSKECPF
jgi:ankyrin repeat protein